MAHKAYGIAFHIGYGVPTSSVTTERLPDGDALVKNSINGVTAQKPDLIQLGRCLKIDTRIGKACAIGGTALTRQRPSNGTCRLGGGCRTFLCSRRHPDVPHRLIYRPCGGCVHA